MAGDPWDWWRYPAPYPIYQAPVYQWPIIPPAQRVKVCYSGHQSYYEVEGDVIQWCSSAERFNNALIQVPAVLLNTGKTVEVVPLQKDLYQVKVETLAQTVKP